MVAKKDTIRVIKNQMQSNHQKAKPIVMQKTMKQVPDGFTITRRSTPPAGSIKPKSEEETRIEKSNLLTSP